MSRIWARRCQLGAQSPVPWQRHQAARLRLSSSSLIQSSRAISVVPPVIVPVIVSLFTPPFPKYADSSTRRVCVNVIDIHG